MQIIKYPNSLDEVSYSPDQLDLKAFYGLSQKVRFCKKCIYSNQKPNSASEFKHNKDSKKETVAFDEEGVCNACRVVERKLDIDWEQRAAELHELCDNYRKNDGSYDCLVRVCIYPNLFLSLKSSPST